MKPKLSKLNPINGVKRIFSLNSLMELIKSLLKIGIIGWMAFLYLRQNQDKLLIIMDMPIMDALKLLSSTVVSLGIRISAAYLVIAAADFLYQKWKFSEDMKMTKQEVKEEYKSQEGDPAIKGKIRQKMQEASRRRMMQALPQADVVITNPTHYAVALRYDKEIAEAPFLVAKGADHMAQKIKEAAKEYDIEIVENKPLARSLYANVELGEEIPEELYVAVAEVLAIVYRRTGRA
jgi:flagellar biosynthetic protein FlhB